MLLTDLERQQSSILLSYLAEQDPDDQRAVKLRDLSQRAEFNDQELLTVIMAAAIHRAASLDILAERRVQLAAEAMMVRILTCGFGHEEDIDKLTALRKPEEPSVIAAVAADRLLRLLCGEPPSQVVPYAR